MSTTAQQSTFGDGHELLYFVRSDLVGEDPQAIFAALDAHLSFLSQLSEEGILVAGGPLETAEGVFSGDGIYMLRAASLTAARQIVARDPLHLKGIRIPNVLRWNRMKNWSVLPGRDERPW